MLRAVAFSRFSREPMLVGGQMLSLQARSQLSTMGEVVDRHTFLWRNAPQTEPHHDLAERPLRQTAWLHRRVDVDYNAWWMCLIPRVGRRGHRAAAAAVHQVGRRRVRPARPVARLPDGDGAGHRDLAHVVPGEGRHQRLAGVLPLPQPARRRPRCTARTTRRRCSPTSSSAPCGTCMLMEYSAVALQHMALRDFLAGPGGAVPEPAGGAGGGPGDARGVRRRPPARLGDRGAAEQPGRARGAGLPGAAHQARWRSARTLARSVRAQPADARPGAPGRAAAQRAVAAGAVVRAVAGWTRRRCRPRRPRRHLPPPRPASCSGRCSRARRGSSATSARRGPTCAAATGRRCPS